MMSRSLLGIRTSSAPLSLKSESSAALIGSGGLDMRDVCRRDVIGPETRGPVTATVVGDSIEGGAGVMCGAGTGTD